MKRGVPGTAKGAQGMQVWPQVKGAEGPGRLQGVQRGPECTLLCHKQLGPDTWGEFPAAQTVPTTELNKPPSLSDPATAVGWHNIMYNTD